MHFVYILYSQKLNRYYTGETHDFSSRLEKHNSGYYDDKWSAKGVPWEPVLVIECEDKIQALAIERHIKAMKSKKYIENLTKYPEMVVKLQNKYPPDCYSVPR